MTMINYDYCRYQQPSAGRMCRRTVAMVTMSVIINDLQLGDVRAKAPVIAGCYQRPFVGWMWANGTDDYLLL